MKVCLFDIDGTLVTAGGVGRIALERALAEVYGAVGAIDRYDFRGKTDPRIVLDLLGDAGWDEREIRARLTACFAAYVRELEVLIGDGRCVRLMSGMTELVSALSAREDVMVGLLTGNIEAGARVKLRSTGLWPRFRVGAFGSDDHDRRRLPAIARDRVRALVGHEIPFARITIIGDTPLDVDCARACGAVAVAVATGQYPHAELAACDPDHLFGDFSDVDRAVEVLCAP